MDKRKTPARQPFHLQLASGNFPLESTHPASSRTKKRTKYADRDTKRERAEAVSDLDGKLSKKILQQAQQQMEEESNDGNVHPIDSHVEYNGDDGDEYNSSELDEDYAFDDAGEQLLGQEEFDQLNANLVS
jgi:hypothetical protein